MEIFLIRHTQPAIEKGICYGQTDLELASSFEKDLRLVEENLPQNINFQSIYSSPLKRCKKLAVGLFGNFIIEDHRLKELDFGDWEMKAWNKIPHKELNPWMEDFVHTPCPNGESYHKLSNRGIDFLNELNKLPAGPIAIVTHAGPIRAMHAHVNNIALKDSFDLKVEYGEIIRLQLDNVQSI
ncbi:alpha-ribazole phosphatase [Echinicola marina]|uniref:alpha-ribazole phosphatase n=1 Tax=Echinicola marina TaxID=2859768 RepID=UPI001CF6F52E|nr:alpha-ribazole phosphatase [Echinicola marina]UCS92839.1 alpha-ribazole phosphatase [Echinicola marina]